jgi:hypothetical protein
MTSKEMMIGKGDVVSVTFRNGFDGEGTPILTTIERAEYLGCENGLIKVAYRQADWDYVDWVELDFDLRGYSLPHIYCARTEKAVVFQPVLVPLPAAVSVYPK